MTLTRMRWLAGLALALGAPVLALAQHAGWRALPVQGPQVVASARSGGPAASLGRPVAISAAPVGIAPVRPLVRGIAPEADSPFPQTMPILPVGLALPSTPVAADLSTRPPAAPAIAPPVVIPPAPTPSVALVPSKPHVALGPPDTVAPVAPGASPFPPDILPGATIDKPVGATWWENMGGWFKPAPASGGRGQWCSDGCLPGLISPLTMPFYAEDPRALTEIRPIFMYQGLKGVNANVQGGSAYFFGTQARLALTDRFSIVLHELGFMQFDPSSGSNLPGGGGLSEIKVGGKYTFWRDANTGTYAAVGGILELPVGSSRAFQDTGNLSLTPYLSLAQSFGRLPAGFGGLNFLGTAGYSISADSKRSEFFYSQLHLDYNVANANTWFPLIELNYIHYTTAGNANNFGFEGADLINFGSQTRQGSDYLSLAGGVRYKFSENLQLGGAIEVPISREKGLNDFRFTFDVIFRY